ncbi:hypothetical protein A2U01_0091360, partial [Trifolium medium]|nr:hypothetical protein [Trifolium medium]
STERLIKPTTEFVIQSPELEKATSEAEVETSPASEDASPEQPIPEQIPADPVIQNSP